MLGFIIEKVSGLSYEDYVSKKLFTTAGMTNTYYCSENKITKNRAHGYENTEKGLVRAPYLDHTWPYSAGSLCSTVEDLVRWNSALHKGRLLDKTMYDEFIKPAALNDGTITKYAKGITVTQRYGKRVFEHGGAIPGLLAQNSYYPDDDMSIVVLANTMGPVSAEQTEKDVAKIVFHAESEELRKYEGSLASYLGTFKGRGRGIDLVVKVTKNDTTILIQEGDAKPYGLYFINGDDWTNGYATYHFKKNADEVDELRIDEIYNFFILKRDDPTR
jgi:CubicO group peptidase (beta-lactamase class C family)